MMRMRLRLVIAPLQAKGFQVVSAPIPVTFLSDDVKALQGALERISGPFVLGAHACSGAVVSAITSERQAAFEAAVMGLSKSADRMSD